MHNINLAGLLDWLLAFRRTGSTPHHPCISRARRPGSLVRWRPATSKTAIFRLCHRPIKLSGNQEKGAHYLPPSASFFPSTPPSFRLGHLSYCAAKAILLRYTCFHHAKRCFKGFKEAVACFSAIARHFRDYFVAFFTIPRYGTAF
jgi:hypothetical protein